MSPSLPSQVDATAGTRQAVFDWEVPFLVDDEPALARGELAWLPGPSPVTTIMLLLVGLAARTAAALSRWNVPSMLAAVTALFAAAVAADSLTGLPPGAEGEPSLLVLPALTILATLAAVWLQRRRPVTGRVLAAVSGVPLLVWGILQAGVLTRPITPGTFPAGAVRTVAALAIGTGASTLAALARDHRRSSEHDSPATT